MGEDVKAIRNRKAGKKLCEKLQSRGFAAYYCASREEALQKALELIPAGSVVSWGGCHSAEEIGLLEAVRQGQYQILDRDTAKTPGRTGGDYETGPDL